MDSIEHIERQYQKLASKVPSLRWSAKDAFVIAALLKEGMDFGTILKQCAKVRDVNWATIRNAVARSIWGGAHPDKNIQRFIQENENGELLETLTQKYSLSTIQQEVFNEMLEINGIHIDAETVREHFRGIWRCADSKRWHILQNQDLLTFDWLDAYTDYKNTEITGRASSQINKWVNEMSIGDLVFVMSKNYYNGIAVVLSKYDYNGPQVELDEDNFKPAVRVKYLHKVDKVINHNLETHNNPATFASIDSYNFGLEDVLEFLVNDIPEAVKALLTYMNSTGVTEPNIAPLTENFKNSYIDKPLNQILYGPPGTGKTHRMQEIIEEWKLVRTFGAVNKNYEEFVIQYKWWELLSLALRDLKEAKVPEIAKHPLVKAKLSLSSIKSVKAHIWSILQSHTVSTCPNVKIPKRHGELLFYKESNSTWRLNDSKEFERDFDVLLAEYEEFGNSDKSKTQKNFLFTTCHQSLSYEDFIEGIKPVLSEETAEEQEESNSIKYTIREGYFYIACQKAAQLAGYENLITCLDSSREDRERQFKLAVEQGKIFVLFLDEINRCNVSAVFGELITLIEDNKRLGAKSEIADVFLPYWQKKFGVPSNLYIIGTMNTADRSVEALDAALRRRFSFTEMMPEYKELKQRDAFDGIQIGELLETINNRIAYLLDKDHQIGHSYFWEVRSLPKLKQVFDDKIIPLLKEYFFNDYGRMRLVLGEAFIEKKTGAGPKMAVEDNDIITEKTSYEFSELDNNGFLAAIKAIAP